MQTNKLVEREPHSSSSRVEKSVRNLPGCLNTNFSSSSLPLSFSPPLSLSFSLWAWFALFPSCFLSSPFFFLHPHTSYVFFTFFSHTLYFFYRSLLSPLIGGSSVFFRFTPLIRFAKKNMTGFELYTSEPSRVQGREQRERKIRVRVKLTQR